MRKSAIYELKKSATGNTNSVKKLRFFFNEKKRKQWKEKLNESNRNQQVNQ